MLVLVWASRFQLARVSAALAVAAVLAGWAAAQRPDVLPGLTLHQAAAGRATLIAVIVAVLAGGVILAPSLGLLLRLMLTGGFDPGSQPGRHPRPGTSAPARSGVSRGSFARLAVACLLAGFVLLTVIDGALAHLFGVLALLAAAVLTFGAVAPAELPDSDTPPVGS